MYPIFGLSLGSQVKMVSMNSWCVDLDAMLSAVTEKTKVIYVANANNPTGTMLPFGELRSFLERVPAQTVVVIDEAYIEFADDHHQSMVSLVTEFSNLVVSRTFSKAYGLAGLRVGYGLANVELISLLEKMRQPFNVNAIALSAAAAAYKDQGFLNKVVKHNLIERAKIESTLDHLGLKYLPSQTNFLAIELPDCAAFCIEFLQSKGVIVRSLKSYQMQNWFRLSVGLEQENRLFITKLKEFLGESIDE
jgi:histidinol-phosphate aminotransferase